MPVDPRASGSSLRQGGREDARERSYAGLVPPIGDAPDALPVDAAAASVAAPSSAPPAESEIGVAYARHLAKQPSGVMVGLTNAGLLTLFVIIAGLTHPAAKEAVDGGFPPLALGFFRFAIASLLLVLTNAVLAGIDGRPRPPIAPSDYLRIVAAALLCVPINQACFLEGIKLASASHGGLFYALNPVLTYLLTLMLGQARWSPRLGLAAVLALVGACVVGAEKLDDKWHLLGDALLFGAVLTWAGFTLVVAPLSAKYGALRTITIVMSVGAVLNLPALLVDARHLNLSVLTPRVLFAVAFITVLTSYLNYILWTVALTRIDVNRIVVSVNAGPIVAVVASHYWLGEPITDYLAFGAVLILTAITLANWDKVRALWRREAGSSQFAAESPSK